MGSNKGKIRRTPQPKVELGQFWSCQGVTRRVVEPLDPWEVHFAALGTGRRSATLRVSLWGAPHQYEFVPKPEEKVDPVHIRRLSGGGGRETFCGKPVELLITTTRANLHWWTRVRKAEVCGTCHKREKDGVHAGLDAAEVAA